MANKKKDSILARKVWMDKKADEMKIITLCGSTRFKNQFLELNRYFTLQGHIVLMPGVFAHSDKIKLSKKVKARLDKLHLKKIDMSDEIVVVMGDYIYPGKSTKKEIEYAKCKHKRIRFIW